MRPDQVAATTDIGGAGLNRYRYAPYGESMPLAFGSLMDGLGYTGHDMDADTGLTYMQQRYYDPRIGRFLSVDPVGVDTGNGGNFNRYWYANYNPYRFTDPDGRYSCVGSRQDCANVDRFVRNVREASRSGRLNSRDKAKVRAVSSYLGKKGVGGPRITATSLPRNTKANTDQRGNIKIDVNKNSPGADPVVHGAMALAHEAQHDVDARDDGEAHTREVATKREKNAYGTEAIVGRANGVLLSPATIEAAVRNSVKNAYGPEPESPDENP